MLLVVALVTTGTIQALPVLGVLGAPWLERLYGTRNQDETTTLLLRHRAVTLFLVGALLLASAFAPGLRVAVIACALISKAAFVALAWPARKRLDARALRVARIDVVTTAMLVAAAALRLA